MMKLSVSQNRAYRCYCSSSTDHTLLKYVCDEVARILRGVFVSVQYLGSVIVVRVRGTQSTEEACLRLRVSTLPLLNNVIIIIIIIDFIIQCHFIVFLADLHREHAEASRHRPLHLMEGSQVC